MNEQYELIVTDEEKAAGLRKVATDLDEFYRRHPDEVDARKGDRA